MTHPRGHSSRTETRLCRLPGEGFSLLSNTVLGGAEDPPGEEALWECVKDWEVAFHWGERGEDPFQWCCLSRNLSKSVRHASFHKRSILGDPQHCVYSPRALLSNCRALGSCFVVHSLALSCPISFPLHSLGSVGSSARGEILIDDAWEGNGRKYKRNREFLFS